MNKSNSNLYKRNITLIKTLGEKLKWRPEEFAPHYNKALKVNEVSRDFVKYIRNLKKAIIANAEDRIIKNKGFLTEEEEILIETDLLNADNIKLPSKYFNDSRLKELTEKMDFTRTKLLDFLKNDKEVKWDPTDSNKISNQPYLLTTFDNEKYKSWSKMYLNHLSLVKAITMLTKLQNDCRNFEAEIIEVLLKYTQIRDGGYVRLEARIIPNARVVKAGSRYQAEVFLYPSHDASNYKVIVQGKQLPLQEAKRIYTITPQKPGIYHWEGVVQLKTARGSINYPFKEKFEAY